MLYKVRHAIVQIIYSSAPAERLMMSYYNYFYIPAYYRKRKTGIEC